MTATIQESAAPARASQPPETVPVSGIVDPGDGHAFVRTSGYRRGPADVYVSAGQIRQYGLRKGDQIEGTARASAGRPGQVPSPGQRATPSTGCRPNSPGPARTSTT